MSDESGGNFDARSVRLTSRLATDMITAECLKPGCGWVGTFSWGGSRLSTITEVSAEHPCRPAPCNDPIHQVTEMGA